MITWRRKILIVAPLAVSVAHLLHAFLEGPARGDLNSNLTWAVWLLAFAIVPSVIVAIVSQLSIEDPINRYLDIFMATLFLLDLFAIRDVIIVFWSAGMATNFFVVGSSIGYVLLFLLYFWGRYSDELPINR